MVALEPHAVAVVDTLTTIARPKADNIGLRLVAKLAAASFQRIGNRQARTNRRHAVFRHIDELGKLIKQRAAQKVPRQRDAWVTLELLVMISSRATPRILKYPLQHLVGCPHHGT